jgi:hypothetical protein
MEVTVATSEGAGRRPFGVYVIILQLLLVAAAALAVNQWLPGRSLGVLERLGLAGRLEGAVYLPVVGLLYPQQDALPIPLLDDPPRDAVLRAIALVEVAGILVIISGLIRLRRWAWVTVMVANGLSMVLNLYHYYRGEPFYLGMLLSLAIVFYLNSRDVQQAFKTRRQSQALA